MTIEQQIYELRRRLNLYNHQYYVENNPVVSDFEFDALLRQLQDLEAAHPQFADLNSPTARVGSDLTGEFQSVEHSFPMLSLSNTYSLAELGEWIDRVEKEVGQTEYVCELKFDGTAISLTYENGQLLRAVTRGDGTRGDDVTANVRTIRTVPLVLQGDNYPDFFEIRGEIYMPYSSFERLNGERAEAGEQLFANPRNAAAGTLKQQQSQIVARRGLDCTLYQLAGKTLPYPTHSGNLDAARSWGFKVSEHTAICRSRQEVFDYINKWDTARKQLPFPTDGVVIKVNHDSDRRTLGFTSKAPKWAVAYKFKAEQASTRLLSIDYQVGRTGAITPVANLEPVQLAGTTVKRATLHNADQIALLDIRIGDMVYVEKGGEIIPKITGIDLSVRPTESQPLEYITECPECGATLVRYEGEAKHYCPNQNGCRPQILGRIEHFVGRKAMDIQALGDKIIYNLYKAGYVHNIDDLYSLNKASIADIKIVTTLTEKEANRLYENIQARKKTEHQVVKKLLLEGVDVYSATIEQLMAIDFEKTIGEKTATRIIENIEESKNIPFHRVLFALGIRFVGETTAKYLAEHFRSLDAIQNASREQLIEAEEVGEKIADAILEYFTDERNQQIIESLRTAGLQFRAEERAKSSNALAGLSFVISGSFAEHSRDELKALIEANGGKNLAAVSANTSYLLAGDKIGPAKLQKANKLGIKIISEHEFIEMIADNAPALISDSERDSTPNIIDTPDSSKSADKASDSTESAPTPAQPPIQGTLF